MTNALDKLKTLRHRSPFTPFAMILSDGRRLVISRAMQFAFNAFQVLILDDHDRTTRVTPADIVGFEEMHAVS